MMIKKEVIGERIKKARNKKAMTQAQLGTKIGSSKSSISKIERGKQKELNLELINSIARELDVRAEYLLGADNLIDREIEFVRDLLKKFSRISTTKNFPPDGIMQNESDIFLQSLSENYLVLRGPEALFQLIKDIALAENLKLTGREKPYQNELQRAKQSYKKSRSQETPDKMYLLISVDEMTEIVDKLVSARLKGQKALEEVT